MKQDLILAVYERFWFVLSPNEITGGEGWSKTYLQLTHTTCLTKRKPKGNKEKQKKRSKNRFCREEKQNNGVFFFFF
jgi:hypothetical protein